MMSKFVIGFNNEFPIIATALNSEVHKDRHPIVHAVFSWKDKPDEKRLYFIKFQYLADLEKHKDRIEQLRDELMKLIVDQTNFKLPFEVDGELMILTNDHTALFNKYALLPFISI